MSISSAVTSNVKNATSPGANVPIFQTFPFQDPVMVEAPFKVNPAGILSVTCRLVIGKYHKFSALIVNVAVSPSVISGLSTVFII